MLGAWAVKEANPEDGHTGLRVRWLFLAKKSFKFFFVEGWSLEAIKLTSLKKLNIILQWVDDSSETDREGKLHTCSEWFTTDLLEDHNTPPCSSLDSDSV